MLPASLFCWPFHRVSMVCSIPALRCLPQGSFREHTANWRELDAGDPLGHLMIIN
jgi:hypothetical protein